MCRSGAIDLICVDSVSALTPRAEIEVNNYFLILGTPGYNLRSTFFLTTFFNVNAQGEIGMQQIGLQARLMSQALRKMSGNASKAGCTLVFLNQIRYKVLVLD